MRDRRRVRTPREACVRSRKRVVGRLVAVVGLLTGALLSAPAALAEPVRPQTVADALDHGARIAGTAWAVDPRSGRVLVLADDSVTGARLRRLRAVTRPFGDAVRVERVPGAISVR